MLLITLFLFSLLLSSHLSPHLPLLFLLLLLLLETLLHYLAHAGLEPYTSWFSFPSAEHVPFITLNFFHAVTCMGFFLIFHLRWEDAP